MRIAVFGAGAVGGYFGGCLARAGDDVVFIARGEHLRAIQTQGLRVDSPKGDFVVQPARATDDAAQAGPVDVIILGVKTWQVTDAAAAMGPMLGPETFIVPLQNGVNAPAQLATALGASRVVGGLCRVICMVVGPGHIRHVAAEPVIVFGELDRQPSGRTERLRQAFERAGVTAKIAPDIHVALWEKLLFLAPWSGLGAITRAPIGPMLGISETRQLFEAAMEEIAAVARARGIALDGDVVSRTMRFLDAAPWCGSAAKPGYRRRCTGSSTAACCPWNSARGER